MSLKYRPEIDGLRAIAVMAVLIYHADVLLNGKNILSGGFIGVDIFFVISGYLISMILLREFHQNSFSLKSFYIRRIRRILPVLFTVMIVSLPFAWFLMMPQEARNFAGSVLSSLGFVSNIWFWQEDSYWAVNAKLKPFLHTWSLSVEEQFYIFYPFILLLLLKYVPRYTTAVMGLGFVTSLALAQYASLHYPVPSFFLLPTRGWELLGGALLAQIEFQKGYRPSIAFLDKWMPKLAVVLIAASLFCFTPLVPHPSLFTLAPVLASMMLIWFCKRDEIVTRILCTPAFVGIGLISYGLYIWHYPIFAFAQMMMPVPALMDKLIWILLSLALATATYFLIERPTRNFKAISTPALLTGLATAFILISSVTGYAYMHNGLWGRFNAAQVTYMGLNDPQAQPYATYVVAAYDKHRGLAFPERAGQKRLLIIGDSYSQDIFNVLHEGGFSRDMNIVTHYIPARCHNVPATAPYQEHIAPADIIECSKALRVGDAALTPVIKSADIIVVTSSWTDFTTPFLPSLYKEITNMTDAPVILFGRKTLHGISAPEVYSIQNIDSIRSLTKSMPKDGNTLLARDLMAGMKGYIDLYQIICGDKGICPTTTAEGHIISHDGAHLTRHGALFVADLLRHDKKFMKLWQNAVAP